MWKLDRKVMGLQAGRENAAETLKRGGEGEQGRCNGKGEDAVDARAIYEVEGICNDIKHLAG